MIGFTADADLPDYGETFRFRVLWDGQAIAGISRVSVLRRATEVIEYRDGSDLTSSRKLPGRTSWDAITLERRVTHDTAFEIWADLTLHRGGPALPEAFRKDIRLELHDEAGRLVVAYRIFRCWVSEYVALAGLDVGGNVLQSIKIENEGWERDTSVATS